METQRSQDWIVVGGGMTGSALAYELAAQGCSVLLLEQDVELRGGSRFGYGGVAFWAGTTDLMRQICAEGREQLRSLAAQLDHDIQYRELDLVLTVPPGVEPETALAPYQTCAMPPQWVDVATACDLEPLLNPQAISGALTVKHGHLHLGELVIAYRQALQRLGGTIEFDTVTGFCRDRTGQITGVKTGDTEWSAKQVVVCAGAWGRSLLKAAGITVPLYFTHAELIETPPVDLTLRSLVMPAQTQRFELEATASAATTDGLWDEPGHELTPPILDAGAIQFLDGSLRLGQISRTLTDPSAAIAVQESEQQLRQQVGAVLPALQSLPGTWHRCLVSFSRDRLPLVGDIPGTTGLYVFSGFSNPLAIVSPLAHRFAAAVTGQPDPCLESLTPHRFCDRLPVMSTGSVR